MYIDISSTSMPILCIVDTNIDVCICTNNSCLKCLEQKLHLRVLYTYQISAASLTKWKKENVQGFCVQCMDQTHKK